MIKFLPFKCFKALTDLSTGEIFISQTAYSIVDCLIKHERAHLLSNDENHSDKWKYYSEQLGLDDYSFEKLEVYRKRFGIPTYIAGNIGNISGIQNLLTDYHLLQAYRKFSQRILSNEGNWEFMVSTNTIRLFPVPKGAFPVVVEYIPAITTFNSPQAKEVTYRAYLAQMKIAVGHARRKFGGIPGPDGSTINFDGDALVSEGREEYEKAQQDAILLGTPLGPYVW
jgi:hypothetical protein